MILNTSYTKLVYILNISMLGKNLHTLFIHLPTLRLKKRHLYTEKRELSRNVKRLFFTYNYLFVRCR